MVGRTRSRSRNSQRSMMGGGLSDWASSVSSGVSNLSSSLSNLLQSKEEPAQDPNAVPAQDAVPAAPLPSQGGKRRNKRSNRHRRRRMCGGNGLGSGSITPSMYKYGSDAAEVHDIQMAQPNTLVGGRRRKRGSRGRSARRSRSRRRSSRRN